MDGLRARSLPAQEEGNFGAGATGPQTAVRYVRAGVALVLSNPRLFGSVVVVYALPSVMAGGLSLMLDPTLAGRTLLVDALDLVTISFAPVVAMAAVAATFYGRGPGLLALTLFSAPWLPRYLWTNLHTSAIFWGPMLALLSARSWAREQTADGLAADVVGYGGWLMVVVAAVYLHSRTLLAPYLAVHGDLPATAATVQSWRLTGRQLPTTAATFLLSAAPVALPLGGLLLGLYVVSGANPAHRALFETLLPHMLWVGIHTTRPLVIAATFLLYRDLWGQEQRTTPAALAVPRLLAPLLLLTKWAPRLGRRPLAPESF